MPDRDGPDGLTPIGGFARLARLTVKALRHYDAEGLLRPARVDPHSGYRYYRIDQVPVATTIAQLRALDVPLPVVREVLAAPDTAAAAAVLAGQRDRLRAELARREAALRALDGLLHHPERLRYDVVLGPREPGGVTGVTGRVRADALDDDTTALCRRVLPATAPLVAVFPLDLAEEFDVTVGVPGAGRPLPGGAWASTVHVGPYATLPLAYTALLEHVRERGHTAAGPVTETYLADPTTAAPEELVTRLAVALAE